MNITLSVPPAVVEEVRAYAAHHGTSLNQLVRDYLVQFVDGHQDCVQRADAFERFARQQGSNAKRAYRFRRQDAYEEELG